MTVTGAETSGAAVPVDVDVVGERGSSSATPHVERWLTITVHGQPAPQGSKRHVGRGVMVESSKKVKPWRQDVVAAAREVIDSYGWTWQIFDGPLAARMVFTFVRPRSHYRAGRNAHLLKTSAPSRPQGIPDLSKLARSTEDALTTAGAWVDDARVVEYDRLAKVWAGEDPEALSTTGALIRIRCFPAGAS